MNELAEPFSMSQQAVSKHLAYLENARLIRKKRRGREHFCRLEAQAIRQVAHWADGYRKFWEASHDRLDELLEKLQAEETPRGKRKRIRVKKETT